MGYSSSIILLPQLISKYGQEQEHKAKVREEFLPEHSLHNHLPKLLFVFTPQPPHVLKAIITQKHN